MKNRSAQRLSQTNILREVFCVRRPHSVFLKRVISPLCWLAGSLVLFVVLVDMAQAGRYEIVNGKGVEVCEAYHKNLNSLRPEWPLLCERPINPELKDFAKPEFRVLDLSRNGRLLWSVFAIYHPTIAKKEVEAMSDDDVDHAIEKWINLGSQELRMTRLDIDNDGKADQVLSYKSGFCGFAKGAYVTALLVQHENKNYVDRDKTDLLLQNSWRNPKTSESTRSVSFFLYNMYDTFIYKNTSYFDRVSAMPSEASKLYVYHATQNRTQNVCEFRFIEQRQGLLRKMTTNVNKREYWDQSQCRNHDLPAT